MKKCPLCGKEYEQEDMCPACKVMLIDTETNSAVVSEPEKKQGSNRLVIMIVLVVAILAVIAAAVFMFVQTRGKKEAEQKMQSQEAVEVEEQDDQNDEDMEKNSGTSDAEDTADTEDAKDDGETQEVRESVQAVSMEHIKEVMASSELSEYSMTHSAGRILDGDPGTAWVEGAAGQGIGEKLVLTFDGSYQVSGLRIRAGYQKDDYAYYNNSRPESISVEFSDGSVERYSLSDAYGQEQTVTFSAPRETSYVSIIIESVYPGTKYEDTCISELSLF